MFVSSEITLAITLVVYMFVILIWFFGHIDEFGFSVNAFKFSIEPVSYDLGLTITYLFNLSGNGFFAEYNMMSLCTDTQWDVLSTGIDTNTTLNVADGKYDKSLYYIHIVYSVILFVSSALLLVIMCFIPVYHDSLNFGYIWTAFLIEMIWFPLYAIVYTMQGWITMMSPTILQGVLNIFKYVLRTVLTVVIVSEYAVSYAMCVVAVVGNLLYIIMYFYLRRRYKNVSGVT